MSTPLVTVVGSANVDFVMRVPRLPGVGETVTDGEFRQVFGGKGANSAVAAARASGGPGRAAFVGRLGDDPFAPRMLIDFRDAGLDVAHVGLDPEQPTGAALVMFDADGDNYLTVAPGSNYALTPAHVDAAAETIGKSRVVLMQMEIEPPAIRRAVEVARAGGATVAFNYAPVRERQIDVGDGIDVLIVNETEAAQLAEADGDPADLASSLRSRGPGLVIVTLGREGVLLCDDAGARRQPGFAVEPVDATAAGDTFCGAFCLARAEGRGVDESARFAQAAAALCVSGFGAQPSIPTRDRIDALLATS